tara:strand:- start:3062 stop:3499 length:438 start_codon:yes stop_codon:yes gene_type:complete
MGAADVLAAVDRALSGSPMMESTAIERVKGLKPMGSPGFNFGDSGLYAAVGPYDSLCNRAGTKRGAAHSEIPCGTARVAILVATAQMDTAAKQVQASEAAQAFTRARMEDYGDLDTRPFFVLVERGAVPADMFSPASWKARAIFF